MLVCHLGHVFYQIIDGQRPFKKDFSRCIYKFQDEQQFSEAWDSMIAKYNLSDNQWLQNLFLEKKKWAFVYGR